MILISINAKNARVTDIEGKTYEGICLGYVEDDDSAGNSVWAIRLGFRKFTQEMVEKIEFLD